MKHPWLAALPLLLACCNANDVLLYGPAAAGAADVTGDGAAGNTSANGGAGVTGGAAVTGGAGGMAASGGSTALGGASANGGSGAAGGDVAGSGGGSALTTCTSDADCDSAAWYCSRLACADPAGVCLPIPIECDAGFDPVCGCDNITYFNACVLQSYGESLQHPHECSDMNVHPPCMADEECGEGRKCAHLFPRPGDMDCNYRVGTCWGIPLDCNGSDADMRRWVPCGAIDMGNPGCVSTCVALESRGAYVPAPPGACP